MRVLDRFALLTNSGFAVSYATCGGPRDVRGKRIWLVGKDGAAGARNATALLKRMTADWDTAGDSGTVEAAAQMTQV